MADIVVVDDDAIVRKTLVSLLERGGHTVRSAANGRDVRLMVKAVPPEIIVTDLIMPEIDGLSLIAEIRAAVPDIRIVAFSGGGRASNPDILEAAVAMGAHAILRKPITKEILLQLIDGLLVSDAEVV